MAMHNSNTTTTNSATTPQALHQRFSWFSNAVDQHGEAEFLGRVYDICEGAKTVLEVVQQDTIELQRNEAPLFDAQATERLVLFTTAALALLSTAAFERIEAMNNTAAQREQA